MTGDSLMQLTRQLEVLTHSATEPGKRGWRDFEEAQKILREYLSSFPQHRQKAIDAFMELGK